VAITYAAAADRAKEVAEQIEAQGVPALVIQADYGDPRAPAATVDRVAGELGRLDILVNNAGIYAGGALDDLTVPSASCSPDRSTRT
jgi:3-oxoacyl-[acyl-carrier protein] reductase